jgi:hypothetical protein
VSADEILNYVRCRYCGGNAGAPDHVCDEKGRAARQDEVDATVKRMFVEPPLSNDPVSADETTAATPLDLDAIEARAQAAGGREWFLAYGANGYPQRVLELGTVILRAECFEGPAFPASTAEHIAGMNPAMTLALVAEVRRLRGEAKRSPAATGGVNIIFDRPPPQTSFVPVPMGRCPRCGYGR